MAIKLIVGLGNPGPEYEKTRHNAGAWFVRALAEYHRVVFTLDKKMQATLADLTLGQHVCKLALPTTYMNHSGQPVRAIMQYYRLLPEEILVAHDELDLPIGTARLKIAGGHGGHNGLRDIIAQTGSPTFNRLRLGIGHPGHRDLVHDFVLTKPSVQDKQQVVAAIDKAIDVVPLLLDVGIAQAMQQLHTL